MTEYGEYDIEKEPDTQGKRLYAWQTAIGLQAVDGLKTSDFLMQTARRNIDGDISIDEARQLIHEYYESREIRTAQENDEQVADKVAANIAKLLGEETFKLMPAIVAEIHRRIFEGVYEFCGQFREVDISKKEWVLRGDTVIYTPAPAILESLVWDIEQELKCDYDAMTMEQAVPHIAQFISGLWQIHPFREGNTRTTAVFLIKYLRYMGFAVDNTPFAQHSWYFRNALVRANYRNAHQKINKQPEFLVRFLRNVMMGEKHELKNRYLIIPASNTPPTEQVTVQVPSISSAEITEPYSEPIRKLITLMDTQAYSLRTLMTLCKIKHRPSFVENYIKPAISEGIVKLLHEDKPNHPRQKYLLTIKGNLLHNSYLAAKITSD